MTIDVEAAGQIKYYELGLPPGMSQSLENVTLQMKLLDSMFLSSDNEIHIDFDEICKSLGIRKNNYKGRHDVCERVRKMVDYYKMGHLLINEDDTENQGRRKRIRELIIKT